MQRFFILSLFICSSCRLDPCDHFSSENIDPPYDVRVNKVTPRGINVDDSGQEVDLEMIDRVVDSVESCMNEMFPNDLPDEIVTAGWCQDWTQDKKGQYKHKIDRECLTIKIPNTWTYSKDGLQMVLDRDAAEYLCEQKPNYVKGEGCHWRAGIQEKNTIVTLPDLYMLPDPLVRYMTSCKTAWVSELSKCAAPRTVALTGEWSE